MNGFCDGDDENFSDHDYGTRAENMMTEDQINIAINEHGFNRCDLEGPLARISRKIIAEEFSNWGFVVIKTWGYGSDSQTWARYWNRVQRLIKEVLWQNGLSGDLTTGLASKLKWVVIQDENLNGATTAQVRSKFEEVVDDERACPSGVDLDIALMIDQGSIRSLMIPSAEIPTYVTAVSRSTNRYINVNGSHPSLFPTFPGEFKIAFNAVITDLWYLLSIGKSAEDLYPGDGVMYRGSERTGDFV